jgi:hypothetical protein
VVNGKESGVSDVVTGKEKTPDSFPVNTFQTNTILRILGKTLISSYLFHFKGKRSMTQ